jgi:porin
MINLNARTIAGALMLALTGLSGLAVGQDDAAPYQLDVSYIHDAWRNTHGGLSIGNRNLDYAELAFQADGGALWNIPQLKFFASANYTNGKSVSGDLTGDAQTASNIEAVKAVRMAELWAEWNTSSRSSFRTGLYNLNGEFDCIDSGALFLNSSHGIGIDLSQSGLNGPSIFPVTAFAGRLRVNIDSAWTLFMAATEGVPGDPNRPKRTVVQFEDQEGALLIAEANRVGTRLRKLGIGTWRYTSELERIDFSDSGARSRSAGAYALADMKLYSPDADSDRGLTAFLRYGVANESVNRFGAYSGAGLTYTGVLADDDQVGFAVARAKNSDDYRRAQALGGLATDAAETNLELTWRFGLSEWLTLQPDLQYIRNPETDPGLEDAFAIGVRFEIEHSFF